MQLYSMKTNGTRSPHGVVHDKNCWLYVHDVVLLRVKEQPVVEEGELGVAGGHLVGAGGQQPANHSPPEKILVLMISWKHIIGKTRGYSRIDFLCPNITKLEM